MADKISQLPASAALDGSEPIPLVQGGATVQTPNGAVMPPDYISGLKMVWGSANSLSVTSGAAHIPSLGRVVRSGAALNLAGLVLTASTWYHLYLYLNAGAPAVECVTTAPAAPYYGTARAKTGDASRRYIGSVLTDASGNIYQFKQNGSRISLYWNNVGSLPMRPLFVGSSTAGTNVSLSGSCPVTATHAQLRAQNPDTSIAARMSNKDFGGAVGDSGSGTYAILPVAPNSNAILDFPLAGDQSIVYWMTATPTAGLTVDVFGYLYER
jgi:hypothetical protein